MTAKKKWRKNMSVNKKSKTLVSKDGAAKRKSWWNKKKIIAVSIIGAAILAAIIFSVVIAATTVFPIASTEEESRVVGQVGKYEVKYEELRYVTLLNKRVLDKELGKYEDLDAVKQHEYKKLLKERVYDDIRSNYVVLTLCEEYGIRTDSLILRMRVQDDIQNSVEESFGGDVSKYKEALKKEGLTDSFFRFTLRIDYLEMELQEHFVKNKIDIKYDESDLGGFIEYVMGSEDWLRTIHAYYPKQHQYIDVTQSASRAENAYTEVFAAVGDENRLEAMNDAIKSAPFVSGFSMTTDGIYFTYGQMGEKYEEAAFALDEYGVSSVVETEDGYFVIMRLPLDEEDVKKQATELLAQYQFVPLKLREDEVRAGLKFEGNEYFDSISLIDIE